MPKPPRHHADAIDQATTAADAQSLRATTADAIHDYKPTINGLDAR